MTVMANDEYELKTLLKMRERERDQAESAYAAEMQELERRKALVQERQAERDALAASRHRRQEAFDTKMAEGVDLAAMQQFDEYLQGVQIELTDMDAAIEAARQRVRKQQRVADERKQALIEAETSLKAVEKHREKWAEEQAVVARRKQSDALDEIASRLWQENNDR